MKIFLLLNQPYPQGYALTKRFHLYAKGFIKNGNYAKLIVPLPREKAGEGFNNAIIGNHEGVPFEYAWRNCERSNSFVTRRFHDLYGSLRTGTMVLRDKPQIIITSSFSVLFYLYLKLIALVVPFKLIREKCEIDYLDKDCITPFEKARIKILNRLFDGFIVITRQLEEFQKKELKSKIPCIKVPILVEDFKPKISAQIQKRIVYTGNFLERKDGILTILKAFSKFRIRFPIYKLILTGSPERSPDYQKIGNIIQEENLYNNLIFTGYLPEKELQNILLTAELHILAKPENRQNHYNFPTKIGEYMVSGRPILVTSVGVMGELLTDQINVFFTELSADAIADQMKFMVENKQLASQIGNNGRLYALYNFDYEYHTGKMVDFFKNLIRPQSVYIYPPSSIDIIKNETT